jgi:hypothetical protein
MWSWWRREQGARDDSCRSSMAPRSLAVAMPGGVSDPNRALVSRGPRLMAQVDRPTNADAGLRRTGLVSSGHGRPDGTHLRVLRQSAVGSSKHWKPAGQSDTAPACEQLTNARRPPHDDVDWKRVG